MFSWFLLSGNQILPNSSFSQESKLDAARRIVPEWTDYDEEVTAFAKNGMKKVQRQNKSKDDGHDEHEHTEL